MKLLKVFLRARLTLTIVSWFPASAPAQTIKRIVIIKVDGLPGYYVDRFVRERDAETGKSVLPWIEHVFYKNGSHLENFYTRGMSLSGPSWGLLDTGQRLQIKGNVEYDRYTLHPYDYLNFFPYYLDYSKHKVADMPAVEALDELKIPLLIDAFPFEKRYTAPQLYQRGYQWEVLGKGVMKLYPGSPSDMIDEWTLGLDFRGMVQEQVAHDIIRLVAQPTVDYFDLYEEAFDHVSHHTSDTKSRVIALQKLDRTIGRIWTAIQASPRAEETALVLVSDHGFNSEDGVYSQGFNLVKLLASATGGGHHVVTKRRLMLDYSVRGLYPLVPVIKTASEESYYLKGRQNDYPTALVDFDGNERSSVHLRNSDLNMLQILHQQLQRKELPQHVLTAAFEQFFRLVDLHRDEWSRISSELGEELGSLNRSIEKQGKAIEAIAPDSSETEKIPGFSQQKARLKALLANDRDTEKNYRDYLKTLINLLDLKRDLAFLRRSRIEELIEPGAMGDPNSLYQLQNYVVGVAPGGLVVQSDGSLDLDRSFVRINYFQLLRAQKVRNNVQPKLTNQPVDFVAVRLLPDSLSGTPLERDKTNESPIWLFGTDSSQALLLSRKDDNGNESFKYVPISGLTSDQEGRLTFQLQPWDKGFPLHFLEDPDLKIPQADRAAWLSEWHAEHDWLIATHRTRYSNAIIGLNEQLDRHPVISGAETADEMLIRRLRQRQRTLIEADLLILANDHWNFDVRGFNPGGNHGSFFRASTNSTLMLAGGGKTGIPRGLTVTEPYDSLSMVPTIMSLMGKSNGQEPGRELQQKGFTKFPGPVIVEIAGRGR